MKSKPLPDILSARAECVLTESTLLPTTGALSAEEGVVISNGSLRVTRSHAGNGGGSSALRFLASCDQCTCCCPSYGTGLFLCALIDRRRD